MNAACLVAPLLVAGCVSAAAPPESPAQVVAAFFRDVRSGRAVESATDRLAPRVLAHQVTAEGESTVVRTPADYADHVREMLATYGPFALEITELLADGDRVDVRWRQTGRHLARVDGFAPTGMPLVEVASAVYRVAEGRIVEYWIQIDREGLRRQLERDRPQASAHLTPLRRSSPMTEGKLGGRFAFPGASMTVHRMGYGAMQLAGPGVYGPPKDPDAAVAVLREAVEAGVDHIDTSDFDGPHVTNQIIKKALHPYPKGLVIVTKVGARRPADKSWQRADSPEELTSAVHDNLRNLGVDALDVVNYRAGGIHGPEKGSVAQHVGVLADLQKKGLIRHIGLSNVTAAHVAEAQAITKIVCVQNAYNLAARADDAFIDDLARQGIAYVPFFPLGGFTPLQSSTLSDVAGRLGATPMQVALAWLLHRAPNVLLIPGTSSVAHLRENLAAAKLTLSRESLAELDGIAASAKPAVH